MTDELKTGTNPLADIDQGLTQDHQRKSSELIYESIMRGGGAPFGAPFEIGVHSLTEAIVGFLRQKGFFTFETLERVRRTRNKFSRYGASNFRGGYNVRRRRKKDEDR